MPRIHFLPKKRGGTKGGEKGPPHIRRGRLTEFQGEDDDGRPSNHRCPSQTATRSGNALYRFYTFSIARAGGRSLLRSRDERQFLAVGFLKAVFAFGSNWAICSALFWRRVFIGPLSGRLERPLPRLALLGSKPPNCNQFKRLPAWSIGNHSHGDPDL
jgi:hypothetical protein